MSNALYYQTPNGNNPTFNGNNSSNGNPPFNGNNLPPNARHPKRVPMACVKCRDRKIKCIPGAPPNHRCARCTETNQECVYLSVAEHTQHMSQTSLEPTDFYPFSEPGPMNHPPPSPPSPHYSQPQSPSSMAPVYSHPNQPLPNQPYQVPAYQNADHQNAAPSGIFPPSNVPPAFSYGPPSSIQSTSPNFVANPYFDAAYQGQPLQGQTIRVPPTRAQPIRGQPIQGHPNHQMSMDQQNNPHYYQRWQQGNN